ncbi:ABC transporter ATP-binding protein [Clostridium estertheticum]|uniref:ABC transporter ATP-binding protein n=1 Tax=Clostridium estertheticum TaxID=238834 RepID=UPI001C7DB757|nr:ABC transporter ATP-binding protein [Clostridium estertheticum]MBX4262064.1 ABC transporter ATP-binding protein [Clostridium estertheticum]WLC72643.1 ABC transporter ATP-binding protein [Clostridium estertheticum]
MNNVVTVKNLEKSYHTKKAIDGVDFVVHKGEILGLLGPNGAGKSTIINILTTILSSDKGEITILGHDLKKDAKFIKQEIGIVPQDLAIYEEISAEKNVHFFASLYKLKGEQLENHVKAALELVGLYDRKDEKPKSFSGGMKRRLNIACAIAHEPQLIIMDEPTVGIDPQSRNHILQSIKILKKRGATVIYSTHYMEEVEEICDRIIIMDDGKIIAQGTKEELKQKVNDEITYSFCVDNLNKLSDKEFYLIDGVTKVKISQNIVEITIENSKDNINEIISVITSKGCKIESLNSKKASLETVFLELTGRNLRD